MQQVINTVGASSLRATLNCDEFATAHSSTAHYDSKSFVGLAWRPAGESICCGEIAIMSCLVRALSHSCACVCVQRSTLRVAASELIDVRTLAIYRNDVLSGLCAVQSSGIRGGATAPGKLLSHAATASKVLIRISSGVLVPQGTPGST
jgi:hypothetical protein